MKTRALVLALLTAGLGFGCGLSPIDNKPPSSSSCYGYDCPINANLEIYMVRQDHGDCQGAVSHSLFEGYDGSESLIQIDSIRNIPIDLGEYENTRNGSKNVNHEDGTNNKENKQRVYVSAWNHDQTMKLERGQNLINYWYSTCGVWQAGKGCQRWDLQERGDRVVNARFRKIVTFSCLKQAICQNGVVTGYDNCQGMTEVTPYVLESDY